MPLGNLTADAIRHAAKADVALNAAGMVRAGLTKGNSGEQTVYDVFLLAPLGIGVADQSAAGLLWWSTSRAGDGLGIGGADCDA